MGSAERERNILIVFAVIVALNLQLQSSFAQFLQFGPCPKLQAEPNFNISRYSGLWYEVEKYWFVVEATATCISVEYFDKKDGTFGVEIAVSDGLTKTTSIMPGSTYYLSNDNSAHFMLDITVTQSPIPFVVQYPYFVLGTDYSNYTIKYACRQLGPLNMQNMWILSREKFLYPESKKIIYEKLRNLGLNVHRLRQSTFVNCRK